MVLFPFIKNGRTMAAEQIQYSKYFSDLSTDFCALERVSAFCTIALCLFYTIFRLEIPKNMWYSMVTKRTAQKQISNGCKTANPENADNVKARVLHVMNVNHTNKRLSTCSKTEGQSVTATIDVSIFESCESGKYIW